jgi:Cu+-exporting ATPase
MADGQGATRTIRLRIGGMGCEGCVAAVLTALEGVAGVQAARVDLAAGTAEVEAAPSTGQAALIAAVDRAGYEAVPA